MKENRRAFFLPAEGEECVPEITDGERTPEKKEAQMVLFKMYFKASVRGRMTSLPRSCKPLSEQLPIVLCRLEACEERGVWLLPFPLAVIPEPTFDPAPEQRPLPQTPDEQSDRARGGS